VGRPGDPGTWGATVLQLRVYGDSTAMASVAERLDDIDGVRHLSLLTSGRGADMVVTADVGTEAADAVLGLLEERGVPDDDVVLTRLETIGPSAAGGDPAAVVWADLLGQARVHARAPGRYLVLMAVAGVIAAFAVINRSSVLIVGAMAVSPDLFPIVAACTGVALVRPRLVVRGLGALAAGLAATILLAAVVTAFLRALDLLPPGFSLGEIPAAQTHVGVSTILIALVAGVAGVVAFETRGSAAVGVAISVTTIPAAAYLGVALALGKLDDSSSALWVAAANVAMMVIGGSVALAVHRQVAARRS
jgi:uncharacterized hydrophobic protein (TIGR00271 family)